MEECLFCKIIAKEIPSDAVYEDEWVYAFRDIEPQAPVHVLIVPKKHFRSVMDIREEDMPYVNAMTEAAQKIARDEGVAQDGFRLVINTGKAGGQAVDHLHLHLLGGRSLEWPPG